MRLLKTEKINRMDKQFKEGSRYLVGNNGYYNEALLELTILEISEKAIKIKFDNGNTQWYLKDKFPYKFIEELPITKETIADRSHEIQFDDGMRCEKDEPKFTLKMTEENDIEIEVKLKAEEKPKLEWQENSPNQSMTWEQANAYAKELGKGWRLPTIEELKEAYESNVGGFQSKFYWSSSALSQNTNYVWLIDFYNGHINDFSKLDTYYVRCVREVA